MHISRCKGLLHALDDVIEPVQEFVIISKNKKIQKAYEEVMAKYAPALKKLADN